jgi:hypothetical protein
MLLAKTTSTSQRVLHALAWGFGSIDQPIYLLAAQRA